MFLAVTAVLLSKGDWNSYFHLITTVWSSLLYTNYPHTTDLKLLDVKQYLGYDLLYKTDQDKILKLRTTLYFTYTFKHVNYFLFLYTANDTKNNLTKKLRNIYIVELLL